jgi:hypothetical protein
MIEMEKFLGVRGLEDGCKIDEPEVESMQIIQAGSEEWKAELDRAIADVGLIAKSRLLTFGAN